jgi:hypothetical protein
MHALSLELQVVWSVWHADVSRRLVPGFLMEHVGRYYTKKNFKASSFGGIYFNLV